MNCALVESNLHIIFDDCQWILMPEESVVKKFYDSLCPIDGQIVRADRKCFPDFSKTKTFLYKFVPLPDPDIEKRAIARRDVILPDEKPIITIHEYPFGKIPLLESHLQPNFVIYNAGKKLAGLKNASLKKVIKDYPSTASILSLYEAWMREPADDREDDPSYNIPNVNKDEEEDDDDSEEVPDYRFEPEWVLRKRRKLQKEAAAAKRRRQNSSDYDMRT